MAGGGGGGGGGGRGGGAGVGEGPPVTSRVEADKDRRFCQKGLVGMDDEQLEKRNSCQATKGPLTRPQADNSTNICIHRNRHRSKHGRRSPQAFGLHRTACCTWLTKNSL